MATEKRLIDANALMESIEGTDWYSIRVDGGATQGAPSEEYAWYKATEIYSAIENAPTVDAIPVKDLERILSTTPGLELWDYQKRGIMSAVNRLCGKEKNDG